MKRRKLLAWFLGLLGLGGHKVSADIGYHDKAELSLFRRPVEPAVVVVFKVMRSWSDGATPTVLFEKKWTNLHKRQDGVEQLSSFCSDYFKKFPHTQRPEVEQLKIHNEVLEALSKEIQHFQRTTQPC